MKWKHILIGVAILLAVLVSIVVIYGFNPSVLGNLSFYLALADPSVRIVQVPEGLRKEQVADVVGDKLGWDDAEKQAFLSQANVEGHYFPKTYLIDQDADPAAVSATMTDEFSKEIDNVKKPASADIINQDTILNIASIIQREAAGKKDMNLISGIIWNRLFAGMNLQIDATLQYAKGSEENGWWPPVKSNDKNIDSSYNTYQNPGLPPTPISNPGLAAIAAAYNPAKTNCLFYLHDKHHNIHCAVTYEQHLKNIDLYLK